jgi:hypothetical protein
VSERPAQLSIRVRIPRHVLFRLLAVLLVLLAAEGLARVLITLKRQYFDIGIDCTNPYADICPYAKDWDIEYGEAMRPSVIFGAAHVPGYQGEWTTINSLGFRGREFDPERPDGDLRIVVLGGSAALGAGVRDDETIPAYLDVEIEDQLACPVEVINGAVAGHMSAQELLVTMPYLPFFQVGNPITPRHFSNLTQFCKGKDQRTLLNVPGAGWSRKAHSPASSTRL